MYFTSTYLGCSNSFFVHKDTNELHPRTPELIEEVAQLIEEEGIEAWFKREAKDFIGEDAEQYNAVRDTLDVWFDSGTTHYAVLEQRDELESPADLYLKVQTNTVVGSNLLY